MATVTGLRNHWREFDVAAELPVRFRHFAWLSTGMFSAAALALAFLGYAWSGNVAGAASNFFASIVSGGLFGLTSVLKFAPSDG
ncbi:MAG: hypothetical protein E6J94_02795 [Methanobacteriota archaeon]|nr:MAG: hypothetical protein E6J99_02115 [Euryarchaeota archaeon]TMA08287.1 MAG: hypothetical protein E6J94_02795 [Euryarchaeota archaeon]